jgi:hypothetical protein
VPLERHCKAARRGSTFAQAGGYPLLSDAGNSGVGLVGTTISVVVLALGARLSGSVAKSATSVLASPKASPERHSRA